jgi:hypothetical protein
MSPIFACLPAGRLFLPDVAGGLVLKTVDYQCKLLDFQNIESLNREHSELSTDFMNERFPKSARKLMIL